MELGGAERTHDRVEDGELAGGKRADHDAASAKALRAQFEDARLCDDSAQAREHRAVAAGARLVDLGEKGVRGVRDDGGGDAGDDARGERERDVPRRRRLLRRRVRRAVHGLGRTALHGELAHRVGDLLEEDWDEARVEAANETLLRRHPRRRAHHARRVRRVGDEADARRLERAEEDVRDELRHRRRGEVDRVAVVPRALRAEGLRKVDLEELNATKLEPPLNEIADKGGCEAGEKRARALLGDDLAEATDHALVVDVGLQLDARLHDVDRRERAVRDAAADATGERAL
mmetsp:Transcript_7899/g.24972  ORF Transcript_7899/g.24972 Transcript_7899/m.24972 type:complete len:290 (-) Transcript_7899:134-1003(-)